MVQSTADFRRLKGVGAILGKRLYDAGFDSFAKIAQAGEEGLSKVRGVNRRHIASILQQARELAGLEQDDRPDPVQLMQQRVAGMREKVENLAQATRDRFAGEISEKCGRKLGADLERIENALLQMHDFGNKRSRRIAKILGKAEKKVTGLDDATLKKVRKGFKKARKTVLKALT
ncbi:helix-hairpin-helix domain-containing protein [Geomonas agri]|uniref:helix-hairpin-helix domain-containing protein n=1 Tax=Geomonas agri TaxID=2873702 RepID=UPI001CD5BB94|nr:helix-hairpin-helix domain-containing protein [Geomonas agri]